jgi:cytochrome c-type biogenesis protein CcmH
LREKVAAERPDEGSHGGRRGWLRAARTGNGYRPLIRRSRATFSRKGRRLAILPLAVLTIAAAPDPADRLPDPAQEARARHLMQEFRCVVCQNESIDDSEADLAGDLRGIVREQVAAGRSDAQVRAFMVDRYGQFVLLKPRFNPGNAALWLTPAVLLAAAGVGLVLFRRRGGGLEPPLTDEEEAAIAELSRSHPVDTVPPNIGRRENVRLTET